MLILHNVKQGTEEWLKIREPLYTGSNADKLLRFGKIPYSKSTDTGFKGNFYTRRGHLLEDEAIELYELIREVKVDRPGFVTNTLYPGCGYSPDGMITDRTIEVKSFGETTHIKMAKNPSFKILAQCHYGQVICEKRLTDLIFYNPKMKDPKDRLIIVEIKYKQAIASNIKRIIKEK